MNFTIENQSFYKIAKIVQVKTYIKRLGKYVSKGNELKGKIFVDVNYYDSDEQDIFSTCQFDYNISIPDEIMIQEVVLKDLKLEVIDNQGINCLYELAIEGDKKFNEKVVEKTLFKEIDVMENIKEEQVKNAEIKQELQQKYDQLLQDSLENREEEAKFDERGSESTEEFNEASNNYAQLESELNTEKAKEVSEFELHAEEHIEEEKTIDEKVELKLEIKKEKKKLEEQKVDSKIEVITTKDAHDERGFLKFFDAFPTSYYEIKTLHVQDESDLNKISADYNVSLEALYKGYDRENRTVVIKK